MAEKEKKKKSMVFPLILLGIGGLALFGTLAFAKKTIPEPIEDCCEDLADCNTELDFWENTNQECQDDLSQSQGILTNCQEDLLQSESTLTNCQGSLLTCTVDLNTYQIDLTDCNTELDYWENENQDCQDELEDLQFQNTNLTNQLSEFDPYCEFPLTSFSNFAFWQDFAQIGGQDISSFVLYITNNGIKPCLVRVRIFINGIEDILSPQCDTSGGTFGVGETCGIMNQYPNMNLEGTFNVIHGNNEIEYSFEYFDICDNTWKQYNSESYTFVY